MLTLVHDRDCPNREGRDGREQRPSQVVVLPPAGGALAHLPGPVVWVSDAGRVVDANLAALDVLLDVGEAAAPLRDAILGTLRDHAPRQVQLQLRGDVYLFQVAVSATATSSGVPDISTCPSCRI